MSIPVHHLNYTGRASYGVRCSCGYTNIHVIQRMQLMQGVQRFCGECGKVYLVKQAPAENALAPDMVERRLA